MRKTFFLVICLLVGLSAQAAQTRQTVQDTIYNCSAEIAQKQFEAFVNEMQTDVHTLFAWAFAGTGDEGGKGGKKDAVMLRYGACVQDSLTHKSEVPVTVLILGSPMFKVTLGSEYRDSVVRVTNSEGHVFREHRNRVNLRYSGTMIKGGYIDYNVRTLTPTTCLVHAKVSITLGTFLSGFLTQQRWLDTADWRLRRIMKNLQDGAEAQAPK